MADFHNITGIFEEFDYRFPAETFRVKANKIFMPKRIEEDEGIFILSAFKAASRFGNGGARRFLKKLPDSELAIPIDLQNKYYKSAIGLLAIQDEIIPVRLETLNTDGLTGLPMIQHALIDIGKDQAGNQIIRFR